MEEKTLSERMAAIMGELAAIPKNGKNESMGFDYARDKDVMDAIRPLMAKYKVAFSLSIIDVQDISYSIENNYGKTRQVRKIRIKLVFSFRYEYETNESFYYAEALDTGQATAINIAVASAEKYFLIRTFVASTGADIDDPDSDHQYINSIPQPIPTPRAKPMRDFNMIVSQIKRKIEREANSNTNDDEALSPEMKDYLEERLKPLGKETTIWFLNSIVGDKYRTIQKIEQLSPLEYMGLKAWCESSVFAPDCATILEEFSDSERNITNE